MKKILVFLFVFSVADAQHVQEIGHVNTVFKALGRDDQVVVEAFDDPKVENVTCYLSRAVIGGLSGEVGLATDPSLMSISCTRTGKVRIIGRLEGGIEGEVIFDQSQNWAFKRLIVSRMLDRKRNALVYLAWSTKILEGSYFNAVSVVPLNTP